MSGKYFIENIGSVWLELGIFVLGGIVYGLIEMIARGYTHWSMILTGGACVLTFYYLRDWIFGLSLVLGAIAGALIITFYEFCVGVIVNLKFGWEVWDYSQMPGNILGQICPTFTGIWIFLCLLFFGIIKIMS